MNYRLALILIITTVILVVVFLEGVIPDDYRINIETELGGVLITVLIVDYLYARDSDRKRLKAEREKLLNSNNLISIYFDRYVFVTQRLLTPPGFKGDKINFEFHDLQNIYHPYVDRLSPLFQKKYVIYFETLNKTIQILKEVLPTIDHEVHPEVVAALQGFVIENDTLNLFEAFKERVDTRVGDEPATGSDLEMIKSHSGDVEYPEYANTIDIYIALFHSIKSNMESINTYSTFIQKLSK